MLAPTADGDSRERRTEGSDVIPTLEAAGFFLTIAAVLGFSTWAEGWLASSSRSAKVLPPAASSFLHDPSQVVYKHDEIRAA